MRTLVLGAGGQVARSLADTRPADIKAEFVGSKVCDLSFPGQVSRLLKNRRPDVVINAAAYTAVDRAEEEADLALAVNGIAVGEIASYVDAADARLIHLSTDFVFDGLKSSPYLPGDPVDPLGAYGESKLAGEIAALTTAPEATMVIRTAWVYSEHGQNFVKTMLRLMAERDALGVVNDQRGSPTYARGLAEVIWTLVIERLFQPGIYHWTDKGDISWYEFALAIQEEAMVLGVLDEKIPVSPITTDEYPTPAERPAYSVLDNQKLARLTGMEPVPWRDSLRTMMKVIAGK